MPRALNSVSIVKSTHSKSSPSAFYADMQAHRVLSPKRLPNFNYIPAKRNLVVFDTETTGISREDRVVSLCVIQLGPDLLPEGKIAHLVFNPGRPSHPRARSVHGFADNYLARQPGFAEHAADIRLLFNGRVLVAHNLSFDRRMLDREFERVGLPALQAATGEYCTMLEYKRRFPGRSGKLDLVLAHLDLNARVGKVHGAMEDAVLAMQVLHHLHHFSKSVEVTFRTPENERHGKGSVGRS